jgi:hypothetical protein
MNYLPAEPEIAVISAPRVMPHVGARSEGVDAFLYIFGLCKQLQATCLDRRGIGCLIDGANLGRLPEAVCRMVGLMVCDLVKDASLLTRAPRPLRVTLRRRGDICLCTISGQGTADPCAEPKPGLRRVRRLAADLGGACMVRSMPERGTVAIMFDARLIEPGLPAAICRYRAAVSE